MNKVLRVLMPYGGKEYINFLEKRFNVEVLTKFPTKLSDKYPNLILFTGGADVSPEYYNEGIGKHTFVNPERDVAEMKLFTAASSAGIPMLGICRGAQFLCVANKGRLIQHVSGHAIGNTHSMTVIDNNGESRKFMMTSTHHQMMYPFDLSSDTFNLIAHSTKFLSNQYLNGDNENLSVLRGFLEPEIVHFYNSRSLAIQGHPEFTHCPKNTVKFSLDLISNLFNLKDFEKNDKK